MTRKRSFVRVTAWSAIVASTSLLVGAAVAAASDLGTFVDLTNALQNAFQKNAAPMANPRPVSPADPEILADFTLVGVIIAGDKRLALVQPTGASSGGPEMLPVGGVLAGYRLTDVEEQQVTLEGQHGERKILRLQTGGGAGGRGNAR